MTNDKRSAPSYRLRDLVVELEAEQRRRIAAIAEGRAIGPTTGFRTLDKELGGALFPGLHFLQAAPGAGKTAFALQVAAVCGYSTLYVTTEMAPLELFRRMIARETRTNLTALNDRMTSEEIRSLAQRTAESLQQIVLLDGTLSVAAEDTIISASTDLLREFESSPLIVIDSLQIWARSASRSQAYSDYEVMGDAVRTLGAVAAELGSPVLCITHRNRAGQIRGGMHASKGTGEIEYCAETILELNRDDEEQGPNSAAEVDVTVGILKNRHGSAGAEIKLRFNGALQMFREK